MISLKLEQNSFPMIVSALFFLMNHQLILSGLIKQSLAWSISNQGRSINEVTLKIDAK